jgi:hypothetical protein
VDAARCACVLAERPVRPAVLRLRLAAVPLARALRCVAVVLRLVVLRRRVLLLRRRFVLVELVVLLLLLLLVDMLGTSSRSCLLGILLELIPGPQANNPAGERSYVRSVTQQRGRTAHRAR